MLATGLLRRDPGFATEPPEAPIVERHCKSSLASVLSQSHGVLMFAPLDDFCNDAGCNQIASRRSAADGIPKRLQPEHSAMDVTSPSHDEVKQPERPKLRDVMGPGLITGASDDDPSGIAT